MLYLELILQLMIQVMFMFYQTVKGQALVQNGDLLNLTLAKILHGNVTLMDHTVAKRNQYELIVEVMSL